MQQGEEGEQNRDENYGLERAAASAGFREIAEFGDKTEAKKKQDDREVPEDGEKIEAVAGVGVGYGFLVFLGREVVGGGGILCGSSGGGSGSFLRSCRGGLERSRAGVVSGGSEGDDEQCKPEQAGHEARGREEVHGKSIAVGRYARARAQG
jgi:hypothetical protein